MATLFAGLDWASHIHAVCVIDDKGSVRERVQIEHNASGLADLVRHLKRWGLPAVAIERPSGLLVDTLVQAGVPVIPIHPNVVKATRPRYRSHGAKSDASDAYLLADLLRTDGHRFNPLRAQSDELRALRSLVRIRDDLLATRLRLANQLRALLQAFWGGAAEIFADIDSPIALAFIERYPTPHSAHALGPKRMASFCSQQGYSGRRSPEELLQRLHQAAQGCCGPAEVDANGNLAGALARILQNIVQQIRVITSRIEHQVGTLEDGRIMMSFPRAGRLCAAQMLVEIGDVRERFDSDEHLAAEAGVAPVTYQSGKVRAVAFRWACNHHLRVALTCMADNSRHASAWAADVYGRAKARGCDHPHAIRILARAWLRVIWRAWVDRKPYDPERHLAAKNLLQTQGG